MQALSNQLGNVVIDAFDTHQAAIGSKSSTGQFTTCAFDNLDHNPSSSTAYGSFHGSGLSITQHPEENCARFAVMNSAIAHDTPKVLKPLPSFYTSLQTIPSIQYPTKLPPHSFPVSAFFASSMSMVVENEYDWLNHIWENYATNMMLNWSSFYAEKELSGTLPKCETNLLPLFTESSTDPSMVYHAMRLVKKSTDFLNPGQAAVMACDQPIYAIAKQLQWTGLYPDISEENFFVMLGGLHVEKVALKLIGDLLKDSEWSKVLVQAGLFTSGVADKLLSASHIKKTRRSHELTLAALHILKMKAFEERVDKSVGYNQWNDERRKDSPMFFYWSLVMELEANMLGFIRAIRTRNWKMYCKYLKTICPWFFALNHHLYARWATVHVRDIEMLEQTDSNLTAQFAKGNFVVTKSGCRFSAMALDQNHEQCNASVKGKGGTINLFQKEGALKRWMISQPMVVEMVKNFHEQLNCGESKLEWLHHEESRSYHERFNEELNCLVQTFDEFGNPFADSSGKLLTICTRQAADEEGVQQLLNLEGFGSNRYESFVSERFYADKDFGEPITKVAIDLFGKSRRMKKNTKPLVKCTSSLLQKVFISCHVRGKETLRQFFKHETTTWPVSLSSNGSLRSTTKSALLPVLKNYGVSQRPAPPCDVYIIDGPALLQMLKPRGDVNTFDQYIAEVVIPYITRKAAVYKRVDIVFDVYRPTSIKAFVRKRRGSGYPVDVTRHTRLPPNWSEFLRNDGNKTALFLLVQEAVISSVAPSLATVVVTSLDKAVCNQTLNMTDISPCDHEEADTRMLLHVKHANADAIVKTVDTDVVVIAISCFDQLQINKLWIEFGVGENMCHIPVHDIISSLPQSKMMCASLPLFHAITGCDTVSSFFGFGKKKSWDCWMLNLFEFCDLFTSFNFSSSSSSIKDMQKFVIALYARSFNIEDIDECRYAMFTNGCPIEKLPPTSAALLQHTRRAIYQAEIWKAALTKIQDLPSSLLWGWALDELGQLIPFWMAEQPASSMQHIIHHCSCKTICGPRCSCKKKGIQCTGLCACAYETCNSRKEYSTLQTDSSRNAFDFLESLH